MKMYKVVVLKQLGDREKEYVRSKSKIFLEKNGPINEIIGIIDDSKIDFEYLRIVDEYDTVSLVFFPLKKIGKIKDEGKKFYPTDEISLPKMEGVKILRTGVLKLTEENNYLFKKKIRGKRYGLVIIKGNEKEIKKFKEILMFMPMIIGLDVYIMDGFNSLKEFKCRFLHN